MEFKDRVYNSTDVHGNELTEEEEQWCEHNQYLPEPFTKNNWKTAKARDTWRDLLRRAQRGRDMAEWKSLLDDRTERKAAIIHVNNYNREEWLTRVGKHGLAYRDIRYTEPYDGFSHKHFDTDINDPRRLTYAVIATNEDVADKMEEAELEMGGREKHDVVGEFLNFPECCREFFLNHWVDEGYVDPMYEVTCNTPSAHPVDGDPNTIVIEDGSPWLNELWRYFGWSFPTHIPCSWECEEAIEVAKHRGQLMAENGYREEANTLYNWLDEPMVWSGYKGIAHIRNEHMIGSAGTSSYWDEKTLIWGEEHADGGSIVEE